MIHSPTNSIVSYDLNNAWRETLELTAKRGIDYKVEQGSYKGQYRRQLLNLSLCIIAPGSSALTPFFPPGFPVICDEEKITDYFNNYLINAAIDPNEEYTYGQAIVPALPEVIRKLRESHGATNQATINILSQETIFMQDPPCLRVLDFKVFNDKLILTAFFRSWDVFAALPINLGGLQLLKSFVASEAGFTDGELIVYSSGAHIYEQYFEQVNKLNVFKIILKA
jgi:thymidylate synthase